MYQPLKTAALTPPAGRRVEAEASGAAGPSCAPAASSVSPAPCAPPARPALGSLVPADRFERFLDGVGALLGRPERRASFAMYALGLLGDGERKSAEPIAARAAGGDALLCQRYHDRLCHFLNSSRWDDRAVRGHAARAALAELACDDASPRAWLVDEFCFVKQGAHSPGVQRQFSRGAGKLMNCQLAVGLTLSTRAHHLPFGIDLFLPEAWSSDGARRARAKVPAAAVFRTRPEIALGLLADAAREGLPTAPVVADVPYGADRSFRGGLTRAGLRYVLGVDEELVVTCRAFGGGGPRLVRDLARELPASAYRPVPWAEEGEPARVARLRVELAYPGAGEPVEQDLLIEWPDGKAGRPRYVLSTLPADTPLEELVYLAGARRRAEASYDELRRGLGLSHFEGRTYVGWQHHVSAVLACYALVVACRARAALDGPPALEGLEGLERAEAVEALEGLERAEAVESAA